MPVTTRSENAGKHPGTEAMIKLGIRPRRKAAEIEAERLQAQQIAAQAATQQVQETTHLARLQNTAHQHEEDRALQGNAPKKSKSKAKIQASKEPSNARSRMGGGSVGSQVSADRRTIQ